MTSGTKTTGDSGDITGLSAGTTYYVRAYATNTQGTGYGNELSFTTNNLPIVSSGNTVSATMNEDGAWSAPTVSATDGDGDTLTWSKVGDPSDGSASVSGTGASPPTFDYAPDTNFSGSDSFQIQVSDGTDTETITVNVTVNAVNDEPSFTKGSDQTVDEDSGAQIVSGWATAISKGAPNESGQTLTFNVSNDNNSLFSAQPTVNETSGNLTYTPAGDQNGSATVTVSLSDNGGTTNGGDDTSTGQTFTITVNPLNDAPVNTVAPSFSGSMSEGKTLTAAYGTWNDDADTGSSGITYAYQWQRADDDSGTGLTDISGATGSTYTLVSADVGKYIRVKVTATDDGVGTPTNQSSDAFSEYQNTIVIITESESTINTTDATFEGTVNPAGNTVTNIRFKYGTTTDYGLEIAATPATASGTSDISVSATPDDLAAGLKYHYRLVITLGGIDFYGDDREFATATSEMPAPGKALNFDGSDDYVAISDATGLGDFGTGNFTVSCRFMTTADGVNGILVGKRNSVAAASFFTLKINAENKIVFSIHDGTNSLWGDGTRTVNDGKWHHVAAVRTGVNVKVYLDGDMDIDTDGSVTINIDNDADLTIGAKFAGATLTEPFNGQIDEVRIWSTMRTPDQIRENMNRTLVGNESGLAAYYRFDHDSGTALADLASGHNDGTLTGMAGSEWTDSSAFNVWTGATDNNWNLAGNWSDGLPTASSNVSIPSGGTPEISTADAVCNHIVIEGGGTLTVASGGKLTVSGNSFNHGNLTANGEIVFSGSSEQIIMDGTYTDLTADNSAGATTDGAVTVGGTLTLSDGTLTMGAALTVNGTLSMAGGTLDQNGQILTYGGSSILEYADSSTQATTNNELPASGGPPNLTVDNAAGVTLHADRTFTGTLTLTSGELSIDANVLTLESDISVTS